jgi:PEP-CTERM motif-containing protein
MKNLLFLVAVLGAITCSFGQGQINFNNSASTLITSTIIFPGVGETPIAPNTPGNFSSFYFGLFVAPMGTPAPLTSFTDQRVGLHDPNWQFVGAYAVNSTAPTGAGRLQNPGSPAIAGFAGGTTVNFIIRGWSANMGTTWAQVVAFIDATPNVLSTTYGTSAMAVNAILGGGGTPLPIPTAWGLGSSQVSGLVLYPQMPEPSAFALAGLGLAGSILYRRCLTAKAQNHRRSI